MIHKLLFNDHYRKQCADHLDRELYVKIGLYPHRVNYWESAFAKLDRLTFLDSITEAYAFIAGKLPTSDKYISDVNRVFAEEHVAYWIDDEGVVHPKPDDAFRQSFQETIKGLQGADFGAARQHITESDGYILQDPPNWSKSIYSVFLAAENIFKVLTGDSQLNGKKLDDRFKPLIEKKYADPHTKRAAMLIYEAFKDWVNCAHNYRHDAGQKEPTQPPEDLALAIINSGYGYVRWLASFG